MSKRFTCLNQQRGVVLFIALIALVVMSLAAAALIRNVDTNTVIAGNLSFKQSAIVSSDRGVETAIGWINSTAVANVTNLEADNVAKGYMASYATLDLDNHAILKADATWANNSMPATGSDITGGIENTSQNNIRYIVQRMCRNPGTPTKDNCLLGEAEIGSGSKGVKDATEAGAIINTTQSPVYRITVRVTGPKNTVSYTQTYVY